MIGASNEIFQLIIDRNDRCNDVCKEMMIVMITMLALLMMQMLLKQKMKKLIGQQLLNYRPVLQMVERMDYSLILMVSLNDLRTME